MLSPQTITSLRQAFRYNPDDIHNRIKRDYDIDQALINSIAQQLDYSVLASLPTQYLFRSLKHHLKTYVRYDINVIYTTSLTAILV